MTTNSSSGYPAEYYYPEFIDSRSDDPLKLAPSHLSLTTSVDKGTGSTTQTSTNIEQTKETTTKTKTTNKKQPSIRVAPAVVTAQGLPEIDITQSSKTDPKKSLLRDPASRNIPRLIVDDSIIKQKSLAPKITTTNIDNKPDSVTKSNQINNGKHSFSHGQSNGDLRGIMQSHESTRQPSTTKYIRSQQSIDDYWKKEVVIDREGVVTIEPVTYDRNTYDGPFGLTRQGAMIFYIGMTIVTILAAIFLIVSGVLYSQNKSNRSSNTGNLIGIGVCAFAFYVGLQLILIGLWHQKYRQENPSQIKTTSDVHNDSRSRLKSSMEVNERYDYPYQQATDYSYQQPVDYTPYGYYPAPPYGPTTNEQLLLQQPGAATGVGYYDSVVWPSNVEIETQLDSKFLHPMEWSYGAAGPDPEAKESRFTSRSITDNSKPAKKSHHQQNKKTVAAEPPKAKFDNLFPNSTVTETELPKLKKAPETEELMRTIAVTEQYNQQNPSKDSQSKKNSNRTNNETNALSSNNYYRDYYDRSYRQYSPSSHYYRQRRRRRSCSTCSTNSSYVFHSDINFSSRRNEQINPESMSKNTTSRPSRTRRYSLTKTKDLDTGRKGKSERNSDVITYLEDIPNVRDDRLEQIPVIRRTVIVEPYPAQPTSQIVVQPRKNITEKVRLNKTSKLNPNNQGTADPSTVNVDKRSTTKKKTREDLKLEDVDNNNDNEYSNDKSKKKKATKATLSKAANQNAFYK